MLNVFWLNFTVALYIFSVASIENKRKEIRTANDSDNNNQLNIFIRNYSKKSSSSTDIKLSKFDIKKVPRIKAQLDPSNLIYATYLTNQLLCTYLDSNGLFNLELLWQSANTMETLSNYVKEGLIGKDEIDVQLQNTFEKTPVIVDNCYDDNQWWGLAWISAYEATGEISYLFRAASVFTYIVENAWDETICGGGLKWCPTSDPQSVYKNAVTNELFLISAMRLHQYESLLNVTSTGYYLKWALKEWKWFQNSGMINSQNLINDGLDSSCVNNAQTTWTYNQGILLDALGLLSIATGSNEYRSIGETIAFAAMTLLTDDDGILIEPGSPSIHNNSNAQIFKGVFVRHLGPFVSMMTNTTVMDKSISFLQLNADSVLAKAGSTLGGFGFDWEGPSSRYFTPAENSAVGDLIYASAINNWVTSTPNSYPLGLGKCVDDNDKSMSNCHSKFLSLSACRSHLVLSFPDAIGYDYQTTCIDIPTCTIYSLKASTLTCEKYGFTFNSGNGASSITTTSINSNDTEKTICVLRTT